MFCARLSTGLVALKRSQLGKRRSLSASITTKGAPEAANILPKPRTLAALRRALYAPLVPSGPSHIMPWLHRRYYASESGSEKSSSEHEDGHPHEEDANQPDGESLLRRELINAARPRSEQYQQRRKENKYLDQSIEDYYQQKAQRSADHLNDVLSRKFFAWNIVGLGNSLGLFLLVVLILRLLHFLYQTRVQLKYQNFVEDYDDMMEEDKLEDIKRPQENPVPPPTAQSLPPYFSVSAQDTSHVRSQIEQLETERSALEKVLEEKKQVLEPRWTILGPVEKAAYTISSFLAIMKTLMTWPAYVHEARALLEDTEPHSSQAIEGRYRSVRTSENFDPEKEESILGHLPGPEDQVYGRPITLLLDTELLLAPGIDKEAGIVTMKRPGIENFMSRVAPYAEIVLISTNHDEDESQGICEKLDPYNFRTACLNSLDTWRYKYRAAKPLSSARLGRPQSRIVAFDRDYELCGTHCDNVLMITPFNGMRGDSALVDTVPFIQFLAVAAQQGRDVREIIAHYRGVPIDKAARFMKELAEEERAASQQPNAGFRRKI